MMKQLLILHGPNLNLLGQREPHLYGTITLDELNTHLIAYGKKLGYECLCVQSNSESECIEHIHQTLKNATQGAVINAAALTHTSIGLRDALLACQLPFIEIHLTHLMQRDDFRRISYLSDISIGSIMGLGPRGYQYAIDALHHHLTDEEIRL